MLKIIELAAIDVTIYSFVLPLIERLRDEGFEISVAAADTGASKKITERGFKVHKIDFVRNLSVAANIRAFMQLIQLFRSEKPDAVHTHTPIASVLVRLAAKLCGVPLVFYTLHGLKTQPHFLLIEKLACKYLTSHIFVVNKTDMKFLRHDCRIPRKKISILNGVGIDTKRLNIRNLDMEHIGKLKKELGLENTYVIGFMGRLIREKGIVELIEAFADLRKKYDCKLLIVGSADLNERDSKTFGNIKRIIKSEGMESSVVFTGHRDDVPEILAMMDLFVLPSYIEGMCISTLEAMSMKLPVVATDIRGIREEVTKSCGILVPTEDSDALSKAVEKIMLSPAKAVEMGNAGRRRVVRLFDQKKILDIQTMAFIKAALDIKG